MNKKFICFIIAFILAGCDGSGAGEKDGGVQDGTVQDGNKADAGDADTDADTDTDSDSDADADSDADGDLDAGEDACMYDPEDRVGWVRTWGGEDSEQGNAVAVGPDGTVVVGGEFWGPADFDPGPGEDIFTPDNISAGFVSKYTDDGEYVWTKVINGSWSVEVYETGITDYGDIIAAGPFSNTADFDPGSGVENKTAQGNLNGYILKLNGEGEYGWVYVIRGDGYVNMLTMDLSDSGSIYAGGDFDTTIQFDYDGGAVSYSNNGDDDSFIAKMDLEGELLWAMHVGGNGKDRAWGVAAGPDDSVAVIGEFSKIMDMDPGPGVDEHTADINDVYLIKLDSDGNYEWGRHIQGPGIEFGRAVEVDDDGNIYAAVEHSNQVDFDPDTAGFEADCESEKCVSIVKYDLFGIYLWSGTSDTDGNLHVYEIKTIPEGILATGIFYGYMDFDPGPGQMIEGRDGSLGWNTYVYHLLSDGSYGWVTTIGNPGDCTGLSLDIKMNEYVVVSGYFYFTVDFDPTACRDERYAGMDYDDMDSFLWKLSIGGNYY